MEYFPRADASPSLHLGEIKRDESVGQSPLVQIPAVTSNVDGHVVTWNRRSGRIRVILLLVY